MSLVSMGPMLRAARSGRYGIAAYNMIDYNSARAIVGAAAELDAPIIVQVSVKTLKHWGYKPVATFVRLLADDVDVPVALHLDHCTEIDIIERCIDAGWTSVMFDGSSFPFPENLAKSTRVYALTQAAGVGLEAEIGAIGGVEDDKVVCKDAAMLADLNECLAFCAEMPELAAFAPAVGTAHGFYTGEPKIAYDLLSWITDRIPIPIALHGGTGLSHEQFERCISLGCGKVNISSMHKRLFIDGFVDLKKQKPKLQEPLPFIVAQHDTMKRDVIDMIRVFGSAGKAVEARRARA